MSCYRDKSEIKCTIVGQMRDLLETIRKNFWLRVGILIFMAAAVTWVFLSAGTRLLISFYAAPPLVASSVMGLATLWLTLKLKPAMWAFGAALVVTGLLMIIVRYPY